MIIYLHSTVVLLKASAPGQTQTRYSYLHSTVVLLKGIYEFYCLQLNLHLHSTVVLLKALYPVPIYGLSGLFTFYCSSIKGVFFGSISLVFKKIYILL